MGLNSETLTPCSFCLNGSEDPDVCTYCHKIIKGVIDDDNCIVSIPISGTVVINMSSLKNEERKAVVNVLQEYLQQVKEFTDMDDIAAQIESFNVTDDIVSLHVLDYMASVIKERLKNVTKTEDILVAFRRD